MRGASRSIRTRQFVGTSSRTAPRSGHTNRRSIAGGRPGMRFEPNTTLMGRELNNPTRCCRHPTVSARPNQPSRFRPRRVGAPLGVNSSSSNRLGHNETNSSKHALRHDKYGSPVSSVGGVRGYPRVHAVSCLRSRAVLRSDTQSEETACETRGYGHGLLVSKRSGWSRLSARTWLSMRWW